MTAALTLFCTLLRRGVLALLLAAFLVPAPLPTPADEVRALYAAQGLLCTPGEEGQQHREAHCVLCLLPAAGAATACAVAERRLTVEAIVYRAEFSQTRTKTVGAQQARAPPQRIV